jgi:hypothetical protein
MAVRNHLYSSSGVQESRVGHTRYLLEQSMNILYIQFTWDSSARSRAVIVLAWFGSCDKVRAPWVAPALSPHPNHPGIRIVSSSTRFNWGTWHAKQEQGLLL